MGLTWLNNNFICKKLYAPFVLDRDCDHKKDLRKKYDLVLKQAENAGADNRVSLLSKSVKKDSQISGILL